MYEQVALPDQGRTVWDEDRRTRHDLLLRKAPQLGWLYGTAVNLLPNFDQPGSITIISHCVREIYNRLPDWEGVKIVGAQGERDNASSDLADLWAPVDPPVQNATSASERVDSDPPVEVPRSHHDAVNALVYWEREGSERNRKRALYFVGGIDAMEATAVRNSSADAVSACIKFFVGHAHIGPNQTPPARRALERQFVRFERILDLRLRDALEASDAVADVLQRANRSRPTEKAQS
jgi:hypothetical protein